MVVCPNCGEDNSDKAKFCSQCATPLTAGPIPRTEERKVVSVLFVDLVGFTARSHDADPEDVRAALAPYHRLLKTEIERFGGTVEKFIGDAVMAVFGAPTAHEDDAERAVRAALRITEAIEELNESTPNLDLSIRAAVNTGEGLVSLGASPQAGEGIVTGDVVNTASRLQGTAPVGGVAVGELTYRSTTDFVSYEPLDPVTVKGKPGPVPVWRAVSARSRFGVDVDVVLDTPFIGRDFDLAALQNAYQRTLREASVQLVTITGEPGIGKTRLLAEFSSFIEKQDELVYWRQGRSLPYGEGITFWALGEIVKAQSGILESDGPETASNKLRTAVDAVVEERDERTWFVACLGLLVGAHGSHSRGGAEKEGSFTAWRRFLEAIASRRPLVVVFEDLHWADAAMLEFIDHLVEWSTGVPLLVVCTARPELYERHEDWGGGKRNSTTIALSPLSDSETAQLISALLSQATLPVEVHSALLERAGGNPLYAEEFIRMLSDRGILKLKGRVLTIDPDADIPMPDSVQALIAARLDTLPAERKALLHDASVAGKVFWSGAVSALANRGDEEVREGLHELARKELVRPTRSSSMEGEQQYSFWHALVRDVAYAQIPRATRGAKHKAMAAWIEAIAKDRVGDHAEVLVHHYTEALRLARAASRDADAQELADQARRFLILAGDRTIDLDVTKAHRYFGRALELLPPGHSERAPTLVKAGTSAEWEGRLDEAESHLQEAVVEARNSDDVATQGRALLALSTVKWNEGNTAVSFALTAEATTLLEPLAAGPELARAYFLSGMDALLGSPAQPRTALAWSAKALALAQSQDTRAEMVEALALRGLARCDLGDREGLEDLEAAVQESLRVGRAGPATWAYSFFAYEVWLNESAPRGAQVYRDALRFAERRGHTAFMMDVRAGLLGVLFDLGDWDEAVGETDDLLRWSKKLNHPRVEADVLLCLLPILTWRGQIDRAAVIAERLLELARTFEDLQVLVPALAVAGLLERTRGHLPQAVALISELDHLTREHHRWRARHLPTAVRVLISAGQVDRAGEFLAGIVASATRDQHSLITGRALVAEARDEIDHARSLYHEATKRWAEYGFVLEEGKAHLGLARCLFALGDRVAAVEPLQKARVIFERLGAVPLIHEADGYLEGMQAASG